MKIFSSKTPKPNSFDIFKVTSILNYLLFANLKLFKSVYSLIIRDFIFVLPFFLV